ncbi:uncharacterized protein LOC134724462 isoform X4 [Mytilus trossulus]|uniref:uncharacterized protein LOC134724462 isoform X4 n=1 Tax=Mytilus trossulus TaxID=6551 RepID=UPI00300726C3
MLLVLLSHTALILRITAQNNLTPSGTATQSSTYERGIAQNAVEPPVSNVFSLNICTHTDNTRTPAWWMFQFSIGIAYITDITIYYRERFSERMDGFKLYVTNSTTIPPDGYLCYADPDPGLPNITQTIPCNELGKYVIYYDNKGSGGDGPLIELCYVAINVSINTAETNDNEVTTRIGIFIGIFMGGVLLGILMTVVVCFVIKRKRKLPQKQSKDNTLKKTQSQDTQHNDDVRMENISTYQDLRMETAANEYDQISTAYDNH